MIRTLTTALAATGLVLGLAACSEPGTTAHEPAITSPMPPSPATTSPTNPVTGTVPGPDTQGAAPAASGGGGGTAGSGSGNS